MAKNGMSEGWQEIIRIIRDEIEAGKWISHEEFSKSIDLPVPSKNAKREAKTQWADDLYYRIDRFNKWAESHRHPARVKTHRTKGVIKYEGSEMFPYVGRSNFLKAFNAMETGIKRFEVCYKTLELPEEHRGFADEAIGFFDLGLSALHLKLKGTQLSQVIGIKIVETKEGEPKKVKLKIITRKPILKPRRKNPNSRYEPTDTEDVFKYSGLKKVSYGIRYYGQDGKKHAKVIGPDLEKAKEVLSKIKEEIKRGQRKRLTFKI